jgi:hypothetical protein
MMRISKLSLIACLLVLMVAPTAFARLAAVGPLNPGNGFPVYYVDTNGVALELPVPPLGTPLAVPPPLNPISPTMVFDPTIPGNAFSQQIGFGSECFYWVADADWTGVPSAVGAIVYRAGLEAAFGSGDAQNGQQIVFSRIRVRIGGLLPRMAGTYTVRHPYGTETIVVTADDIAAGKGLSLTRDIGVATQNFANVLNGDVGPFLIQTAPIALANVPIGYPTTGWVGDGNIISPVTGSPIGFNQVSITPPSGVNLGAGNGVPMTTSNFIVSGHRFNGVLPTPLTVNRVSYTRNATNTFFDVFATSELGATVSATIGLAPAATLTAGVDELAGLFWTRSSFGTGFAIPPTVTITASLPGSTNTIVTPVPTDLVTITQAVWHTGSQLLTVSARSSDTKVRPTLTLVNPALGALVGGIKNQVTSIPSAEVIVSSSAGGVATKAVTVITP